MANRDLLHRRNALADGFQRDAAELAGHFASGFLSLLEWLRNFARLIAHGINAGFLLGRGTKFLTEPEHAIVAGLIGKQYEYAKGFVRDIHAAMQTEAPMSEQAIANRSGLYAGSVVEATERGNAERWSVALPAYPGDGSTTCKTGCRCHWEIEDSGTVILATWHAVDDAGTCAECEQRSHDWAPLNLNTMESAA